MILAGCGQAPAPAISGISNGELMPWGRGTDTAEPQALARLALDLDGAQLFAGGAFAGLLDPDETASLHPDWLRGIGADLRHGAAELFGIPQAEAQEEEEAARRLGPGGRELTAAEELRLERFNEAIKELRAIEPDDPQLSWIASPEWIPDEAAVTRVEIELGAARGRATGRSNALPPGPPATAPVGGRGVQFNVMPGTNPPTIIAGRYYTGHALDEMQNQGIVPSSVENAITTGARVPSSLPGTVRNYDPSNDLSVVTSESGRVLTVFLGGSKRGAASGGTSGVPGDDK